MIYLKAPKPLPFHSITKKATLKTKSAWLLKIGFTKFGRVRLCNILILGITAKPLTPFSCCFIKKSPIVIIFERQVNCPLHKEFYIKKSALGQIIKGAVNITA